MNQSPRSESSHQEDDFWTERIRFFTAQLPARYTNPQKIRGRFHISKEKYSASRNEIIPIKKQAGLRTYVMMQPYVLEPKLTLIINLYNKPKNYIDQDIAIGQTIGHPKQEGFREVQIGNAQAWYYHTDKTIVLWECFLDSRLRVHPLGKDTNMRKLWKGFEYWLRQQFPQAAILATPFNDPIARSSIEYQEFLKTLGYAPIAKAAFGKTIKNSL